MKRKPVVFGDEQTLSSPSATLKGSKMKFENSRYIKKPPNPWREIVISEANLIVALEYALRQTTHIKPREIIERVIVGEPVNGQYPLSIAVVKKEDNAAPQS